jgi:hypothetical protein
MPAAPTSRNFARRIVAIEKRLRSLAGKRASIFAAAKRAGYINTVKAAVYDARPDRAKLRALLS